MSQPSELLTDEENQKLKELLGRKVISKSTAVVQFYTYSNMENEKWQHVITGVTCFSRDANRKSYYIQVYNMDKNCLEWEQEVYNQFLFTRDEINPQMFTFEAEKVMVLFYFADKNETDDFNAAIEKRLEDLRSREVLPKLNKTSSKGNKTEKTSNSKEILNQGE